MVRSWRAIKGSRELGVEGLIGYQREHVKAEKNFGRAWAELIEQQKIYQDVTDDRRLLYSGLDGFEAPRDRYPIYVVRYKDYKAVSIARKKLEKMEKAHKFFLAQERETERLLAQATRVRKLELQRLSKGDLQQELNRYKNNLDKTKINFIQADRNGRPRYLTLTVAEADKRITDNQEAYISLLEKANTGDEKVQRQLTIAQANVKFDEENNVKEVDKAKAVVKELEDMLKEQGENISETSTSRLREKELSIQAIHTAISEIDRHLENLQKKVYRDRLKIHNTQADMPELLAEIDKSEDHIEKFKSSRTLFHERLHKDIEEKERLQNLGKQTLPAQARKKDRGN